LYPTVGLQTPGEVVEANFGQIPFVFDIEDYIQVNFSTPFFYNFHGLYYLHWPQKVASSSGGVHTHKLLIIMWR
jgi:hypothetical protein